MWIALLIAQLVTPARPLPRSGHALVYDTNRRAVLLVNGDHPASEGEVWEIYGAPRRRRAVTSGENAFVTPWRLIDTSGPIPRTLAGVAYDTARNLLVMQGGLGTGDTAFGDTQEWDGVQWRQVAVDGPGVRNHQA